MPVRSASAMAFGPGLRLCSVELSVTFGFYYEGTTEELMQRTVKVDLLSTGDESSHGS